MRLCEILPEDIVMMDSKGQAVTGEVVAAINAAWAWSNMLETMPPAWNRRQVIGSVENAWRRAMDRLDED